MFKTAVEHIADACAFATATAGAEGAFVEMDALGDPGLSAACHAFAGAISCLSAGLDDFLIQHVAGEDARAADHLALGIRVLSRAIQVTAAMGSVELDNAALLRWSRAYILPA